MKYSFGSFVDNAAFVDVFSVVVLVLSAAPEDTPYY